MKDQHYKLIFWAFVLMTFILACVSCNSVKKVLKDENKMREVWEKGVLKSWCVNDTVSVSKSDTLITLDTIYIEEIDTADVGYKIDPGFYTTPPVVKSKTIIKTVKIRDTVIKVITDKSKENLLQKEISKLLDEQIKLKQDLVNIEEEKKAIKKERNKWRLYFFLLLGGIGLAAGLLIGWKVKTGALSKLLKF